MRNEDLGFWLKIAAPVADPAWRDPRARKAYWDHAARFAEQTWKRHRAMGLDRYGKQMAAIHHLTAEDRQADRNSVTGKRPYSPMGRASAFNPPLQSTGARSRTQSLLRWEIRDEAGGGGVYFYWARDPHTGLDWGIPLARHAGGFFKRFYRGSGYVRPRDVRGFSPNEIRLIEAEQGRYWARERQRFTPRAASAYAPPRAGGRPAAVDSGKGRGPVSRLLQRGLRALLDRVGLAGLGR